MTTSHAIFTFEPSAHALDDDERRNFRNALGHYPTGVTVVTALGDNGAKIGLTVNSFSSISLKPPLILFAVSRHTPSAPVFQPGARFVVNLLGAHQRETAQHFARSHADKFAGIDYQEGQGGVPILSHCSGWLESVVDAVHGAGDHWLVIGQVDRFAHVADAAPLIWHHGKYKVFG